MATRYFVRAGRKLTAVALHAAVTELVTDRIYAASFAALHDGSDYLVRTGRNPIEPLPLPDGHARRAAARARSIE